MFGAWAPHKLNSMVTYFMWSGFLAPERIPHDEYGRTETGIKYCKWLVSLPPLWCQCFTSFTLFNIWWVDDLTDADEPQGLIPTALFPPTFHLPHPFIILLLIPDWANEAIWPVTPRQPSFNKCYVSWATRWPLSYKPEPQAHVSAAAQILCIFTNIQGCAKVLSHPLCLYILVVKRVIKKCK